MKNPLAGLLSARRDALGGQAAQDAVPSRSTDLSDSIADALRSRSGSIAEIASANEVSARAATFAAAYRSVTLIAGAIAQLPIYLADAEGYKIETPSAVKGRAARRAAEILFDNHMISGMFYLPNLMMQMATDMAVCGNSFLAKIYGPAGVVDDVEYLSPLYANANIQRDEDGRLFTTYNLNRLGYGGRSAAVKTTYSARELVHARMPSMRAINNQRALLGSAPMDAIQRPLLLSEYADDFKGEYYRRGAFGNMAIISFQQKLDADQAIEIEERLHRKRATDQRRRAFTILGSDAKVTPITVDTQSVEMARHSEEFTEQVARAYGIPGSLIGIKETTKSAAGLEELTKVFIRFCLMLYRRAIEHAITYALFRNEVKFCFDITAFTAADLMALSQFITATQGDAQREAIMTTDELRSMVGDIPKIRPKPGASSKPNSKPNAE